MGHRLVDTIKAFPVIRLAGNIRDAEDRGDSWSVAVVGNAAMHRIAVHYAAVAQLHFQRKFLRLLVRLQLRLNLLEVTVLQERIGFSEAVAMRTWNQTDRPCISLRSPIDREP